MANQVFAGTPGNEYSVIDNSAAPSFPTLSNATHIGYDTILTGATAQGTNPQKNGSIPDFLAVATTILNAPNTSTFLRYKNPS